MSGEILRCSNCNAPLDVTPETIAIVCSYCGHLNWVKADQKDDILIVKPMDNKQIVSNITDFGVKRKLGNVFNQTNLSRLTIVIVPFYFVNISAEADYSGRVDVSVRRCRRERDQERCWIETHNVFVNGVFGPYNNTIPILGRRGSNVLSVRALAHRYLSNKVNAISLESSSLDKNIWGNILSIEIDKRMAMDIAMDIHLDGLRKIVENVIKREAENKVRSRGEIVVGSKIVWKRITPRNIAISSSKPTLLPMYIAVYRHGSELYRIILCGWDGEVIALERPMKTVDRIFWGSLAAIGSGIIGGIAGIAIAMNSLIGVIPIIIGFIASWYCMKKAIAPVKTIIIGSSFASLARSEEDSRHSYLNIAKELLRI